MKRLLVAAIVLAAAIANGGQEREAYPGQREHKQPPKNFFCSNHPSAPKNHKCACAPSCAKSDDGTTTEPEDPKCTTYCWAKTNCACAHQCSST